MNKKKKEEIHKQKNESHAAKKKLLCDTNDIYNYNTACPIKFECENRNKNINFSFCWFFVVSFPSRLADLTEFICE